MSGSRRSSAAHARSLLAMFHTTTRSRSWTDATGADIKGLGSAWPSIPSTQ